MMQLRCKPMGFGPTITNRSPLTSGVQGVPFSLTLTGTGGKPPYTYALIMGTLDSGVTLSASGVFSGTPINSEVDTLGLQITDANGTKGNVQLFILTFVPSLTFVGETLPTATPGVAYSQNISGQASSGTPPYTFTLLSTTGTDIWTVSPSGVINGIPGQAFLVTESGNSLITETTLNLVT